MAIHQGQERVRGLGCAEEHVLDDDILVDGVVDGLANLDIAQVIAGDIHAPVVEAGHGLVVEGDIRIGFERFDLAVGDRGGDVEIAALELQHAGVGIGQDVEVELVQIWLAGIPIAGVFLENDLGLLFPGIEGERPGADRMLEEFVALCFVGGLGDDTGREEGQVGFEWCPRCIRA